MPVRGGYYNKASTRTISTSSTTPPVSPRPRRSPSRLDPSRRRGFPEYHHPAYAVADERHAAAFRK